MISTETKVQRIHQEIRRLETCLEQLQRERAFAQKILLFLIASPFIYYMVGSLWALLYTFTVLGIIATLLYLTSIRADEYRGFIQDHQNELKLIKQNQE